MMGFLRGDDDEVLIRFKLKNETEQKEKQMSYSHFKEFKQNNNMEYCRIVKVVSKNKL